MPRPQLHTTDDMLDAARDLVLDEGIPSATIEAIAEASGAPTGSIYHRFGSRDGMLAAAWTRAVQRSQGTWLSAAADEDPRRAAVGAALAIMDFCTAEPEDARLLVSVRRSDLFRGSLRPDQAAELAELNKPVERAIGDLARRLFGRRSSAEIERTIHVTVDVPFGATRRHLIAGAALPSGLREDVAAAAEAVIDAHRT